MKVKFEAMTIFVAAVVVITAGTALALDISGAKEQPCFTVKPVYVDFAWVEKETYLSPWMSRYNLYKVVEQLFIGDVSAEDIIEGSVYYDACLYYTFSTVEGNITGYGGGRETRYLFEPATDGGVTFRPDNGPGFNGTFYTILTDNKTFIVLTLCDGDDQMMWRLFTTTPHLPSSTLKNILKEVVEMGFKEEYFTELRYETCKKQSGSGSGWAS